jgi:Ni,Fe-hydrogenase III small subunit
MKTIRKSLMILLISLGGCGLTDQEISPKKSEEVEISEPKNEMKSSKPDPGLSPSRGN